MARALTETITRQSLSASNKALRPELIAIKKAFI